MAQIRSATKRVEEGEKNTKYFLNLEKAKARKNVMGHVKRENGETVLNQMDVLKEQVTYYSSLYCQSMQIEGSMMEVVLSLIHI